MGYEDQADLASDVPFGRRVASCVTDEAKAKSDNVSQLILRNPAAGSGYFMPFVATAPGFGDAYQAGGSKSIDDEQILAAVQACWDQVSALYPEPLPPA